ncbi:MAG: GNAT family N-acetyltransferase [Anaerolineaceae bacterium]|nr:GNAT family N-acetyltransferase [Anaerolineaceae bacterium]
MSFEIVPFTRDEILQHMAGIVSIYRAAFNGPPYGDDAAGGESFASHLRFHSLRSGFRFFAARCTVDSECIESPELVGFSYGYTGGPGLWWFDLVSTAIDPEIYNHWMTNYFEVVELAVTPGYQGLGLGSNLHDRLLAGLPHHTAVLSTIQYETTALLLYRKRGWVPLLHDFYFPGSKNPYLIMGFDLRKSNGRYPATPG